MPRIGIRARLTLMIAAVFVAAGAVLVLVQNVIVQRLFDQAIATSVACTATGADDATTCEVTHGESTVPLPAGGQDAADRLEGSVVYEQSHFLADAVGGGLATWSIAVLAGFTVIAALLAYWLSRQALRRIHDVTVAAEEISQHHLDRRLDLPGPDDEIKELGDTIDRMLERLQLAFAAQDRFIANASHELRTPLTTARAALEIPLEQGDVPLELEPAVRRALRANEQSERLISALLLLARGRIADDRRNAIDLADLIREQLAEQAGFAEQREIAVTEELEEGVTVDADAVLLDRAVRNLLDNGIRHNVPGGLLRVDVRAEHGLAVVRVENTGAQLDPDAAGLLVEPFYRGAAGRSADGDGVGLGLAIVEGIASAHRGTLRLEARRGGGLVARLEVPRAVPSLIDVT